MDNWVTRDKIKRGLITYNVGETVVLFRRKKAYPKLEDDVEYTIQSIENDFLLVRKHSGDGIGWTAPIKVHKTYVISKSGLRDIKIDILLK